jgi:hypothetical protein
LLHPHENWSKFLGYQGWVEVLMITLVSSQKSLPPNIAAGSVLLSYLKLKSTSLFLRKPQGSAKHSYCKTGNSNHLDYFNSQLVVT